MPATVLVVVRRRRPVGGLGDCFAHALQVDVEGDALPGWRRRRPRARRLATRPHTLCSPPAIRRFGPSFDRRRSGQGSPRSEGRAPRARSSSASRWPRRSCTLPQAPGRYRPFARLRPVGVAAPRRSTSVAPASVSLACRLPFPPRPAKPAAPCPRRGRNCRGASLSSPPVTGGRTTGRLCPSYPTHPGLHEHLIETTRPKCPRHRGTTGIERRRWSPLSVSSRRKQPGLLSSTQSPPPTPCWRFRPTSRRDGPASRRLRAIQRLARPC